MPPVIRSAAPADDDAIATIYDHYVRETIVTFEEEPVGAVEMGMRVREVQALGLPWLVAEEEGTVVGYAYATKWKQRIGYRFSVEISVYLHHEATGRGLGAALYAALLEALGRLEVHAVIGGVALPNDASQALHRKFGFEQVAHFRETGRKFGRWIDVVYWEKRLPS